MARKPDKLTFSEPFDCERLLDLKSDQLDSLVKECEINVERIRNDIVKTYKQAQPYILQLNALKRQLRQTTEKMEAAKTFLAMENNGSLVSSLDLSSLKVRDRDEIEVEEEEERPKPSSKFKTQQQLNTTWTPKTPTRPTTPGVKKSAVPALKRSMTSRIKI